MAETDIHYIARCLDGHPDDFRYLVRRYQTALLAHLAGQLHDKEKAEDAAQETLVRAYFNLSKLKKQKSFFSWLLGISGRVVKEQQRDRQRRTQIARSLAENRPTVGTQHDYPLARTIAQLPDSYRELILLRYYSGLSCSQISRQLDMPLGTVTKTLSRAYVMLRDLLRPQQNCQDCEVQK
ncbi:MAG TPA: RNA polymerase sigma factor [Planctomycetes bacterium]|nr:RNA polymerase sigma factor [Planctomycetota bacterium]